MTTAIDTFVLIRVQARGGKYLGPSIGYSQISVWNGETAIFGPVLAQGGSGTVDTDGNGPIPANASPDAIVVTSGKPGPPAGAYWLTPDDSGEGPTAGVVAKLSLTKPALLEFRAVALFNTPNPVTSSAMMWVYPGQDLTAEPGVLLTMPGLAVSVTATVTTQVNVTGTLTMMCGCPITTPTWPQQPGGSEPYWPYTEFNVFAVLTQPDGTTSELALAFSKTNTFIGSFPLPPAGTSVVGVCAVQQAASNIGYGETTVVIS